MYKYCYSRAFITRRHYCFVSYEYRYLYDPLFVFEKFTVQISDDVLPDLFRGQTRRKHQRNHSIWSTGTCVMVCSPIGFSYVPAMTVRVLVHGGNPCYSEFPCFRVFPSSPYLNCLTCLIIPSSVELRLIVVSCTCLGCTPSYFFSVSTITSEPCTDA